MTPLWKINFSEIYSERDAEYFSEIERIRQEHGITTKLMLENYMAFVRRREFAQTVAYIELFNKVRNIPGSIAELGVYLGNSMFTWAKLLETFSPGIRGHKVFGFDTFAGYPNELGRESNYVEFIKGRHGHDFKSSEALVTRLVKNSELDNLVAGAQRIHLYPGDVSNTLEQFVEEYPGVRFRLINIDLNLYEPTRFALQRLSNLVVNKGVICFRGYGVKPWEGESAAVDEFVSKSGLKLQTIEYSPYPGAYAVKE